MIKSSNPLPLNQDDKLKGDPPFEFPEKHVVPSAEADSPIIALSLSGAKGEPLYCQTCKTIKPERTHHCKECNRCAPKMDQ